ncbi:hypothetical protein AN480_26920 (plasmid) [Mycobacterium intracellulare subsp. chimaera]|nr:hypothetical protein AN480_26920 [Mycobacterium intracellulare subsp. chimaera]
MREHGVRYQQALAAVSGQADPSGRPATHRTQFRWLKSLGIEDISTYDPTPVWKSTAATPSLRAPIGYLRDHLAPDDAAASEATPDDLAYLDITAGGPISHGVLQGRTGFGKSYFLNGGIASIAVLHNPTKVQFVFVDFKGGATFSDLERLPHVAGSFTGRDMNHPESVSRLVQALADEASTRETLLRQYNVESAIAYRQLLAQNAALPPLPLIVVIIDEFLEEIAAHPDSLQQIARIASDVCNLGIHIVLAMPYIPHRLLPGILADAITATPMQDILRHTAFRVSLATASAVESRVLIGDDSALTLPIGWARVRTTRDGVSELRTVQGFDVGETMSMQNGRNSEGSLKDVKRLLIDRLRHFHEPVDTALARALKASRIEIRTEVG